MNSCGFSGKKEGFENPYPLYTEYRGGGASSFYAANLCVTENFNYGMDQTDSQLAAAAGAFNLDRREVLYSQNLFKKMYPASTTKILTAYIIIRGCGMEEKVTVSDTAVANMQGSSVCGISAGDVLSVRQLLYGLLLASGNDAANALAEYYAGSTEEFARVMNEEAAKLGATASHFVNANGLPDEEHYTTVYDMYLILQEAVKLQEFIDIIQTASFDADFVNGNGKDVKKTWTNTNRYINGAHTAPDGFTVVGGKTGTTNAAGHCLALYSTNEKNEKIISIVFKADGTSNLYLLMDQILVKFAN